MSPTLSISRWIFLFCLPVVMLVPVEKDYEAHFSPRSVGLRCCRTVFNKEITMITSCFEQQPRYGCRQHAFLIKDNKNKTQCINPSSEWLKDKIKKEELNCPPVISK